MTRACLVLCLLVACKNEKPGAKDVEDREIPTVADYQAEANREVTADNVEAEVAKMEADFTAP